MAFPVDEIHIVTAENELGRTLPQGLRSRLRRSNGGEVQTATDDWRLYPIFDPSDRKRAARSANHIVRETEGWRCSRGFPAGAIAIADDGAGNALILRAGMDEIERWDHETSELDPVVVDWG